MSSTLSIPHIITDVLPVILESPSVYCWNYLLA